MSHKPSRLRRFLEQWTRLPDIEGTFVDVPANGLSAWVRTTSGVVVMLLVLQVVTGVLLGFYYVPSTESAYTTVAYIEKVLPAGSWIRALHHYGSQWLTVFLALHLIQMFWRASYRRRPVAWIASIALLALVLSAGATGYSLPWDARAFFGTRVAEGIAGGLPLFGEVARRWLIDGTELSTLTLSRFSALHVLITPALLLLVIVARLFIFREPAAADTLENEQHDGGRWKQLARQAAAAGLIFLALALYAMRYPAPLGPAASEVMPGYLPRPGAQFLWLLQMLKYLPGRIASLVAAMLPGLMLIGLVSLPFLDARQRRKTGTYPRRRVSIVLFAAGCLLVTLMTAIAYLGDRRDPSVRAQLARQAADEAAFRSGPFEPLRIGEPKPEPTPGTGPGHAQGTQALSPDTPPAAYLRRCANCHGSKGQGVKPFPKLLGVSEKPRRTVEDIIALLNDPTAYALEPPMRSFATRLSDDEMRQIAEWLMLLKKR